MLPTHFEHVTQSTLAFGTAGASAIAALTSRLLSDVLPIPGGFERLIDLGFAGIFILALLWGMRVQWNQRLVDQAGAAVREEKLIALIENKESQMNALEREVREVLVVNLQNSAENQKEMLALMRRRESRDLDYENHNR